MLNASRGIWNALYTNRTGSKLGDCSEMATWFSFMAIATNHLLLITESHVKLYCLLHHTCVFILRKVVSVIPARGQP